MCAYLGKMQRSGLGYFKHKVLHGIVGGIASKALYNDFISGCLGAIVGEVAIGYLANITNMNLVEVDKVKSNLSSKVIQTQLCVLVAALLSRSQVQASFQSANFAIENNAIPCILLALSAIGMCLEAEQVYNVFYDEGWEAEVTYLAKQGIIYYTCGAIGFTKLAYKIGKGILPYKTVRVPNLVRGKGIKVQG